MTLTRREFVATAGMAALAASSRASAQVAGELRVLVGGGDYGRANIEAFVKPFQAETGIQVTPITDSITRPQFELMVTTNQVAVDVLEASPHSVLEHASKGYLESIDYSIYQKSELDGIIDFCKQPYGVGNIVYSFVMVYNTEKFPLGKSRPTTWAEFWDVKKFPGVRMLQAGKIGTEGPWEEALLADGVPAHALYPMDIDHIFASLDKIKPHIRKWWFQASEIQQMMYDKAADVMNSPDGRATLLVDQGAPIEINRNQAKLSWLNWVIPKGTPNAKNAQKFIEFATRADRQAALSQLIAYGPSNRNALKLIPDKVVRKLATYPDYMASSIPMNAQWYAEVGSDGMSNTQRLVQRWNRWILA
ncbi:ABC transporter substrate-binding protein [Bradyrhizobium brasilense]|uniref:ABC transporter substrate-binding protein n=1 Tax=Bradyrhizobium brasilense TaxID=1419277 RepID=UPI0024B05E2B|nr:ABC transporter substrate-binding protein [Bradyrhizobium australafricanum]WFU31382.1 ABC transporter substrate-binding protein [Bradyrhizobium australafricanum]